MQVGSAASERSRESRPVLLRLMGSLQTQSWCSPRAARPGLGPFRVFAGAALPAEQADPRGSGPGFTPAHCWLCWAPRRQSPSGVSQGGLPDSWEESRLSPVPSLWPQREGVPAGPGGPAVPCNKWGNWGQEGRWAWPGEPRACLCVPVTQVLLCFVPKPIARLRPWLSRGTRGAAGAWTGRRG